METVYDLMRDHTCLEVICGNAEQRRDQQPFYVPAPRHDETYLGTALRLQPVRIAAVSA
jgi:hypothetical protein